MQAAAVPQSAAATTGPATTTPRISSVHAFGPSVDRPADTSTPLTPHFQPYPDMHQKRIEPEQGPETAIETAATSLQREEVVALATEMSDQPLSTVAAQAEHITHPDLAKGIEFQVEHTKQ